MKDLSRTYVHHSDRERRKRRIRGGLMLAALMAAAGLAGYAWAPVEAGAVTVREAGAITGRDSALANLHGEVGAARERLGHASERLERWNRVFGYARRYRIAPDLARAIYDAAVAERLDPDLAFPVVRLESAFKERATSPVGAIGLTQLMLGTAREFEPSITREQLYHRDTNLRIGFRYLRRLIQWQKGDVQMALLAYNRGPGAVVAAQELALDASNGYDRIVLKGYRGRGTLD
ncbi:MAG: transglycosylase SLT domain-containing protein [Gemmatimonadetes bacterium]|nr:transglycosylase SLT domain-containing protein [Gemmatimonadota bacterium]